MSKALLQQVQPSAYHHFTISHLQLSIEVGMLFSCLTLTWTTIEGNLASSGWWMPPCPWLIHIQGFHRHPTLTPTQYHFNPDSESLAQNYPQLGKLPSDQVQMQLWPPLSCILAVQTDLCLLGLAPAMEKMLKPKAGGWWVLMSLGHKSEIGDSSRGAKSQRHTHIVPAIQSGSKLEKYPKIV